jgi:hypothetical protein
MRPAAGMLPRCAIFDESIAEGIHVQEISWLTVQAVGNVDLHPGGEPLTPGGDSSVLGAVIIALAVLTAFLLSATIFGAMALCVQWRKLGCRRRVSEDPISPGQSVFYDGSQADKAVCNPPC